MVGRLVCSIKWINVVKGFKTASCTGYKALTLLAKKGNGGGCQYTALSDTSGCKVV